MLRVLIADDSPTARGLLAGILSSDPNIQVVGQATNGAEAVQQTRELRPDLVTMDVHMPRMDGYEATKEIMIHSPTPIVIVTASLSARDVAATMRTLQAGAASYIPKRVLERDLLSLLRQMLGMKNELQYQQQLLECLSHTESRFSLSNDPKLAGAMRGFIHENLCRVKLSDRTGLIRLGVALDEALTNAMWHGNLECSSKLREGDGREFDQLLTQRRQQPPYCDRRVEVTATFSHAIATIVIRDEGPGFDTSKVPDPTDPENLVKASGRGLLLIRTFMDEVFHNASGNQITMIKRREG